MPRRFHKQADFNFQEIEKIKKVQGDKTDYRFFREAILDHVSRTETPRKESSRPESGQNSDQNRGTQGGNEAVQASDQDGDPFT